MRVWVIAALLGCACAAPALTPLEDEIDSTTTTDSPVTESIAFETNTIKQKIEDNEKNAVTNPSIIAKNSDEKETESNDFAETTPESKRQRGYVTDETEKTVTSQQKSDYDDNDPDTSTTKYDARPNNTPTLKTKTSDEDNQGEVEKDEHVRPGKNGQNEGNEDEARRISKNIETNNSDIDNESGGDEDEKTRSFFERRTTKSRKTNNSDKDNQNEGDDDDDFHPHWKTRTIKHRKINSFDNDNQNEGDDDDDFHPPWDTRTLKNRKVNSFDKDNQNEGDDDDDFRPRWDTRTLKNRKVNNSDKDNNSEGDEDEDIHLNEEIGTSKIRKTYKSTKGNHNEDDEDEDIHPYGKRRTFHKYIHNEGNEDDDIRPFWGRHIIKNIKTKNTKTKNSKTKYTKSTNTKPKPKNKNQKNWAIFVKHFGKDSSDINTKRENRKHTIHVKRTKYPNLGMDFEMRDTFPSRNHKYYNHLDDSREDDRRNNYEPGIDRHHNKGIWNHLDDIWIPSVDKYRRIERYPDSYDSHRGRSEYHGGRKHYSYKDSEEYFSNSPDRKSYDDYHRHGDDNYNRRTHSRHGYRDRKRYRNNNWHEGRRYYNKEWNSGRKDYKDYHRNDEYNRDDRYYGNFARHNGWRPSKSYSGYEDF